MASHPVVERTAGFIREKHLLPEAPAPVIVGVSGGVDSMALLSALIELGYQPVLVHLNYRLRGEVSDADEALVRKHAAQLGVTLVVRTFDTDTLARELGQSIQVVARDLRYQAFLDAALEHGARHVAVAHHADDQAETVLLNLLRGAGPEGLAGMPAIRTLGDDITLVRPFLPLKRTQILDYARRRGLAWRDDASNESPAYRRGALRSEILPKLNEHFGGDVASRIVRSADLMRQYVESSFGPETDRRFEACRSGDDTALAIEALAKQPTVWRRRILLLAAARWLGEAPDISAPQSRPPQNHATAEALDDLLESQAGRRLEVGPGEVWREQDVIRFIGTREEATGEAVIDSIPGDARIGNHRSSIKRITIDIVDNLPDDLRAAHRNNPLAEYIDANQLVLPLTIRPWCDGDRMRPLGMTGSKKVSDILTDARVPSSRRRQELVVQDAGGIVWLVGHRIDDRVRIRPSTTQAARLVLTIS